MPYPIGTQADRFVAVEITSDRILRVYKGKVGSNPGPSNDVVLGNVGGSVTFDVLIDAGSSATVTLEAAAWPDDYGDVETFVLGDGRPFGNADLPYGLQAAKRPDRSKRFVFTPGLLKHQGSRFSNGVLGDLDSGGTPAFTGQLELAPFESAAGPVKYFVAVRVGAASKGKIHFSTPITINGVASQDIAL